MIEKISEGRMVVFFFVVAGMFSMIHPATSMADALSSFKGESGTIKISGGTAHIPVMKEAAKRIMRFNPNIRITIAGGGSGVGIKQVGEGLVDIGNSGRKATDAEISKYSLHMLKWAIDGVGVVVHPQNPVKALLPSIPGINPVVPERFSGRKLWQKGTLPTRHILWYQMAP
jgi:phosphate transport system substrate-binding protein